MLHHPSRHSPLRLNGLPLLIQVGQQAVVCLVEQAACERREPGEDVTWACMVFATLVHANNVNPCFKCCSAGGACQLIN
jgi:hypothetical protein